MNEENLQAIAELREFIKNEKEKPIAIGQAAQITWKEIAIGVYIGGIALAATSTILWLIFTAIIYAALKK